jgi:signal transduction histidine kinase
MNTSIDILLVDDTPQNLVALESILGGLGYNLVKAESAEAAMMALLKRDFALIILDIKMPGMSGLELARVIKERKKTQQIPIIFLTAHFQDEKDALTGYDVGAVDYLTKPVNPAILKAKVGVFAELHRKTRQLLVANDELQASNKELADFSYTLSHDMRTPLRAITGFSGMLRDKCADELDAEAQRLIGVIEQNALKMVEMFDAFLRLSRLGRQELDCANVDMDELLNEVIEELTTQSEQPFPRLDIKPLPPCYADRVLVRQILSNLLSNAIKFTRHADPPAIEIAGWIETGQPIYCVKDNGAGFDMQYASKLFGLFHRLHGIEEFEGIGLGLATVQRIVHRHGGKVWAVGEVNHGARFYFSLTQAAN